jgi:lipoprotein-releasing system permease protein
MRNLFETFVAMRYLRDRSARREGRGFVRFVMTVGIGGVAVGVAALLIALSIVHGFSLEIKDKIEGLGAHLQVESQTDAPLGNSAAMLSDIRSIEGVVDVRAVAADFVLLRRSATDIDGVVMSGVDRLPPYLAEHITQGQPDISDGNSMLVGKTLAQIQGLDLGDRVTVFAFSGAHDGGTISAKPRVRQFQVSGIFETSLEDFDETFVFTDLGSARQLLELQETMVTRLDVSVGDDANRLLIREEIESRFGFPVMVRTIEEVHRSLFAWIQLQESIIPVVIGFIVLVAVFNIGGILLMIVMEKTRSIGVMVSMGATRRSIRRLVLTLSGLIGSVGVLIGSFVALALAVIQKKFAVIPLPADAYYMSTAPIELQLVDFLIVGLSTLTLCLLFAYIPARFAARLDPIRVIRFE